MAINNFIPTVWSAALLENLRSSLVYGQPSVINRDYEGEISAYGDTVKINNIGEVTIGDYTKNTDIGSPEALTDATRTLTINQAKYFNFQVDDVDAAQQNPKVMQGAMSESAYALKKTADAYIASLYSEIAAGNFYGTDGTPKVASDASDAYEYLVDLSVILDEADVPEEGRFVIIPAWYHVLLLKDDRFVNNGTAMGDATRMNGMVGEAAVFMVLKSNQVPNTAGAKYKVIAGYPGAWSYAEQVNDVEAYRPEKRFADAVKGLHLYGAKVVRPTGLALMTVSKS
jgi:hypothetical protein